MLSRPDARAGPARPHGSSWALVGPPGASWEAGLRPSAARSHWRAGAWRCRSHAGCVAGNGRGVVLGSVSVERGPRFPRGCLSGSTARTGLGRRSLSSHRGHLREFVLLKTTLPSLTDLETPPPPIIMSTLRYSLESWSPRESLNDAGGGQVRGMQSKHPE